MLTHGLFIIVVVTTTAAVRPEIKFDEFEEWFIPFYHCNPSGAEEIKSKNNLFLNKLSEVRMIVWPKIDEQSAKLVLETANRIKPVLVKFINSTCDVIGGFDDKGEQLLKIFFRDSEMLEVLRMSVIKNFTVGDLYAKDTLVEKLTQEFRVMLNHETVKLTESEKSELMGIFVKFLVAAKEACDGLETIYKSLTLEEMWTLKLTFDRIAKDVIWS